MFNYNSFFVKKISPRNTACQELSWTPLFDYQKFGVQYVFLNFMGKNYNSKIYNKKKCEKWLSIPGYWKVNVQKSTNDSFKA